MKLVIQIPCFNEEPTLPVTLDALPTQVEGFDELAVLVLDDGSTDGTRRVAEQSARVDFVLCAPRNRGLARTFAAGLEQARAMGADVIVNIDADNQYEAAAIDRLCAPILRGEADIVVGCRRMEAIPHFSGLKRRLQRWGSAVVQTLSGTDVPDVTSGFRAFSRNAASRLFVHSDFTYTIETLIQAGRQGLVVAHVSVGTNPPLRPSRLFRGNASYVLRSIATMARIYTLYQPLRVFSAIGGVLFVWGGAIGVRFLYYYLQGQGDGKIQSLILAAVLIILGFNTAVLGVLSDLLAANRRLLEENLHRLDRDQ
ncbi:MAG: glycosyltransferase family 2 protein [Candidatus Alcyoniella australis]|nr:glycosyltransferase family 2 protein [Candidatus Alcyoniella australis]